MEFTSGGFGQNFTRHIPDPSIYTEMLKGSQGRLFGKLNEVVDKQIELKHAVEGLRGWRKVTLANVLDRTAMVVMKEEPIMPQAPGRDNEDMRSELSYYMDRGDLCGNPPSGD